MNNEQIDLILQNLRVPVDAIVEYSKLIASTDNKEMQRLYANIIETNGKLLQQLMKSVPGGSNAAPAPASAPVSAPEPVVMTPTVPAAEKTPTPAPAPAPAFNPAGREKITLLVAEDNDNNYFLLQNLLEDEYNLIHAWDGIEAIDLFKKHNPRLILMDISMPRMDGYEATREIRKLSPEVPIIAVTAYAFASDKERIMSIGFSGYLSKPLDAMKLENELQKHI